MDEVNGEPTVFKVYSDRGVSRPSQSYHIQVRSERVKQEVMEKIREVIQCHVVCLRKVWYILIEPFYGCARAYVQNLHT